jgi:hypothetical protein
MTEYGKRFIPLADHSHRIAGWSLRLRTSRRLHSLRLISSPPPFVTFSERRLYIAQDYDLGTLREAASDVVYRKVSVVTGTSRVSQ